MKMGILFLIKISKLNERNMLKSIDRNNGKRQVSLQEEDGKLNLMVMTNGNQWNGTGVDLETLSMIKSVIEEKLT